ncbi:hypothetical protein GGR53DRAFT_464004 [Hypoxylon sp. FL1150]|nr:hypothetical protein GGR53DRAFT_464004 [Hypoxylon sp. FL1150]
MPSTRKRKERPVLTEKEKREARKIRRTTWKTGATTAEKNHAIDLFTGGKGKRYAWIKEAEEQQRIDAITANHVQFANSRRGSEAAKHLSATPAAPTQLSPPSSLQGEWKEASYEELEAQLDLELADDAVAAAHPTPPYSSSPDIMEDDDDDELASLEAQLDKELAEEDLAEKAAASTHHTPTRSSSLITEEEDDDELASLEAQLDKELAEEDLAEKAAASTHHTPTRFSPDTVEDDDDDEDEDELEAQLEKELAEEELTKKAAAAEHHTPTRSSSLITEKEEDDDDLASLEAQLEKELAEEDAEEDDSDGEIDDYMDSLSDDISESEYNTHPTDKNEEPEANTQQHMDNEGRPDETKEEEEEFFTVEYPTSSTSQAPAVPKDEDDVTIVSSRELGTVDCPIEIDDGEILNRIIDERLNAAAAEEEEDVEEVNPPEHLEVRALLRQALGLMTS